MPNQRHRRTYFVDKKVQGVLLLRVARYWLLSVIVVGTLTVLGWMFVSPGLGVLVKLRDHLPFLFGGLFVALAASIFVLPVILYDLARLTNRIAGPMLRLRRAMQQAAAGEQVAAVHFRDDDYWQEFADAFNTLNARLQSQDHAEEQTETVAAAELVTTY